MTPAVLKNTEFVMGATRNRVEETSENTTDTNVVSSSSINQNIMPYNFSRNNFDFIGKDKKDDLMRPD